MTRHSILLSLDSFQEENLERMSDKEAREIRQNYPMLPNSALYRVINFFQESNKYPEIVDFINSELEWRAVIREKILNMKSSKKLTWGIPPKLYFQSNYLVNRELLSQLGTYIINIMFWGQTFGSDGSWFSIKRHDVNDKNLDLLIELAIDSQNRQLMIRCAVHGGVFFDTQHNRRSLSYAIKLIELIAEKENWIRAKSYT